MQTIFNILFLSVAMMATPIIYAQGECDGTPTEYVMQFLNKSTTLWRCSDDWKNKVQKNGSTIETVYAQTHLKEYCGLVARYIQLSESGVKAHFKISMHENCVEIESSIEDHEVRPIKNGEPTTIVTPNKETQTDFCSTCKFTYKVIVDENDSKIHIILISSCNSKIPYALFMKKIYSSSE